VPPSPQSPHPDPLPEYRERENSILLTGHICLDIIPKVASSQPIIRPGGLTQIGPAVVSTGGAVSNVGVALHRLGVPARLNGRIGDDAFGRQVLEILRAESSHLADGMKIVVGETTSYTIVIAPPGVDRAFLHCPGANDSFTSDDVDHAAAADAKIAHFGYPPIMRRMYEGGGAELSRLFERLKQTGTTTSLDLCGVDPNSAAGKVDWPAVLRRALPSVDLFLPSIDELSFMLRRPVDFSTESLRKIATEMLSAGAAVVALKLGGHGLYVRTTPDRNRFAAAGRGLACVKAPDWLDREISVPCFKVDVVNATGAGDCTIAGFLAAVLRGESLENAATAAAAVGASVCESPDANTVPHWTQIKKRIESGWEIRA
jgi:sugar/nucleoside kinase (ribokinase family)